MAYDEQDCIEEYRYGKISFDKFVEFIKLRINELGGKLPQYKDWIEIKKALDCVKSEKEYVYTVDKNRITVGEFRSSLKQLINDRLGKLNYNDWVVIKDMMDCVGPEQVQLSTGSTATSTATSTITCTSSYYTYTSGTASTGSIWISAA